MERKKIAAQHYFKLIIVSIIIAICSASLAYILKHITEIFEHNIFHKVQHFNPIYFIFLPTIGITAIYFLRKYLFKNRKNKGITEIYKTIDQRKDHLPLFKVPSHFINGFLTVIFGGSTGIEVSTVVATATIGNMAYEQEFSAKMYKRELVCAGVAAGVAVLFTSPLAGLLFAIEVIARKKRSTIFISCAVAALVSCLFIFLFDNERILSLGFEKWNWFAFPFFIILSFFSGALSVYFTWLVTRIKTLFANISNNFLRVNIGALIVGGIIYFYPVLYGESYAGLNYIIEQNNHGNNYSLLFLTMLMLLKPLASSLTLGAGGDGGVFAPSIVAGAFLGLLFATLCNVYFHTEFIPLNFALVGAATTLSASIYAPFTSMILVCNMLPNGYGLFFPLLVCCFISWFFAKKLLPYNVYTYDFYLSNKANTSP